MKTNLNPLSSIVAIVIVVLFAVTSCSNCKDPKTKEALDACQAKLCEELQVKPIKNQLIFKFDSCANQKLVKEAIAKLRDSTTVRECMCKEEIILVEFSEDEEVNLEDALTTARQNIDPDGLGSVFFNFEINIPAFKSKGSSNDLTHLNEKEHPLIPLNQEIVVAVIDGGIKWDTPLERYAWENPREELIGNCNETKNGASFVNDRDFSDHGTLVSSLIAENMEVSKLRIMDLRVFDSHNKGNLFDAICAMNFAIQKGADIINMSWGYYKNEIHSGLLEMVLSAQRNDIILVASAGNKGINTDKCFHFPSGFDAHNFNSTIDNIISVAYLDGTQNKLSDTSNYGNSSVSIAAQGVYNDYEGTSFATPKVTRMIAKLRSYNRNTYHGKIINCVLDHPLPTPNPLPVETEGKLDELLGINCP